jgi:uncharacterized repeat protein (TIGR04138 family)
MSGLVLGEAMLDTLRRRNPTYHETAYFFVLAGLQFTLERMETSRHVSGRELALGCRDLALERWGVMSRPVLAHWGIHSTRDIGELVFALVECGVLLKQDDDSLTHFEGVYDFEEVFERSYPWGSALRTVG